MTRAFAIVSCVLLIAPVAYGDQFGEGDQRFQIEFVAIDGPGGNVTDAFRIARYEVSREMIEVANEIANLGVDLPTVAESRGTLAAGGISWIDAAKFVNWINENSGSNVAYNFSDEDSFDLWQPGDDGFDPSNPFRNRNAKYFLPSLDEWRKAAYFDPVTGGSYTYPTGRNQPPTPVESGTAPNTAVFGDAGRLADVFDAGGLSAYGTMAQGGNVWEWVETDFDGLNDMDSGIRSNRGGNFNTNLRSLEADARNLAELGDPGPSTVGFRVASVPEPSGLHVIIAVFVWVVLLQLDRTTGAMCARFDS